MNVTNTIQRNENKRKQLKSKWACLRKNEQAPLFKSTVAVGLQKANTQKERKTYGGIMGQARKEHKNKQMVGQNHARTNK